MSLRVWLPLDGDLRNLGISDLIFSAASSNTTTNANGKIGTCYTNNSHSAGGLISDKPILLGSQYSMCCWFKFTDLEANSSLGGGLISLHRYSKNTGFGLTIKYVSSTTGYLSVNTGTGSARTFNTYCGTTLLLVNTWYHACGTYDGTNIKIYVNGILEKTQAYSMSAPEDYLTIFCWSLSGSSGAAIHGDYKLNGALNDVRIYDHCLSAAEVKEIALGLVLHYKLDGGLFGNPNLLLNTHFDNRYNLTTGWDTTKNGTLLASNWGGYNSGVANLATCYHAHLKLFNNEYVYEYTKDTETWLGISLTDGLQNKLVAGKTYTFSCELYSVTNTNYMRGGLYYFKTGATSAGFHLGYIYCNTNRIPNTWQKFTYTFTAPSDGDYSKTMRWYCYGHSGGAGTFYLRHLKLEEGSIATPWCPADSEMNIDRTIIEDSSGYNHNGVGIGNLKNTSDTKRYDSSIKWNSSDPTTNSNTGLCYILTPLSLTTPLQLSFTWWAKPESGYGDNTGHAVFCTSNNDTAPTDYNTTAFHHRDSGFDIYPSDGSGVKRLSFSYTKNEWHHYAVTYDGTTARTYLDGVLKTSIEIGANKTLASFSQLYIGFSKAGGVWRKTLGSYSDFRVYVTQLLDTDIKLLYNVSMKIDKSSKIHSFEVFENNLNKITKQGQLKCANIIEFNGLSYLKYDSNLYIEPDGSCWVRIFHHNNPANGVFSVNYDYAHSCYVDADRWFNMELCNYVSTWELMIKQKYTNNLEEKKWRWIQNVNPMTATFNDTKAASITRITTAGYSPSYLGGYYYLNTSTTACLAGNNGTNGNWWGGLGTNKIYLGGTPGYIETSSDTSSANAAAHIVTTGYIDCYIRIDNLNIIIPSNVKSTKNNLWLTSNVIER